jgi:hypothetical protein
MSDDDEEIDIADEAGEIEEEPTEGLDVWPPEEGEDADGDGHPGEDLS